MSRLIDADALKDILQNLAYDDWNQGVATSWANAYGEIADMVEDAPTIEPVRMKGKWIEREEDMDGMTLQIKRCSECGASKPMKLFSIENFEFNFCPNCGADMRGEEDDN